MFDTAYTFHLVDRKQLSNDGRLQCTWKYPMASFGFVGSHSINKVHHGETVEEQKANTQRFRIYQIPMFNFFGTAKFI